MITALKEKVIDQGWFEIENILSNDDLLNLAMKLGEIMKHPNGELIAELQPKSKEKAVKDTLSHRHEYGSFPLHTDTAFWSKPARFVILSSKQLSTCSTVIIHQDDIWKRLNSEERKNAEKAIYVIKTPQGQHYCSLLFQEDGVKGFRYDPTTMIPVNKSAKLFQKMLDSIIPSIEPTQINWTGNKAVVFDNWRTLHGRNNADKTELRTIKRIYLN